MKQPVLRHAVWIAAVCFLLFAPIIFGCGRGPRHAVAPVSGRVTLHGKPMADIGVSFQPMAKPDSGGDAGYGSYGVTDQDGRFQLRTMDGKPGAVVGRHVVRLSVPDKGAPPPDSDTRTGPPPINPFPCKASDGSLTFEVPADGADEVQFDF